VELGEEDFFEDLMVVALGEVDHLSLFLVLPPPLFDVQFDLDEFGVLLWEECVGLEGGILVGDGIYSA
jgi:hypothetical protein